MTRTLKLDNVRGNERQSMSRPGALRTYLVIGGDEHERGIVAGNVARAAGTIYRTLALRSQKAPAHACAARSALAAALTADAHSGAVLLVDSADPLFADPASEPSCPRCRELDGDDLLDVLRRTGGTFLFGVDTAPSSSKWQGWHPDVVVYLARPQPSGASGGAGKLRVRFGSLWLRARAG